MAQVISSVTGYAIKDAFGSVGGYKDWCIDKYGIPSFTIEAGRDDFIHPMREDTLGDILTKNKNVLFELSKVASILREY